MDQIVYIVKIIKPARQRNIRYYLAYVTIYALLFSFFNHLGMLKRITRRISGSLWTIWCVRFAVLLTCENEA